MLDLSNPKILAGLLTGGLIPHFLPAIPAAFTKWLLFRSVIRNFPRLSRLRMFAVTVAEPCLAVAISAGSAVLPHSPFAFLLAFLLYSALAMFANLLLFPPFIRSGLGSFVKKAPYAYAMGQIYLAYFLAVTGLYFMLLRHYGH